MPMNHHVADISLSAPCPRRSRGVVLPIVKMSGASEEVLNTCPRPPNIARHTPRVLRTKHGRLIKADEWLQAEKRLLARPVHPSVESCLHFKQVPVAKFDANGDLQASVERLTQQTDKSHLQEERQKPRWVQQELQHGRWVDSERPWRRIGTAERCQKCVGMHDRAAEDRQAKLERLLNKYCQPLVKSKGNITEKHNKMLVKQYGGRPHMQSQIPYRTSTGRA